jgi:hypothetical protein
MLAVSNLSDDKSTPTTFSAHSAASHVGLGEQPIAETLTGDAILAAVRRGARAIPEGKPKG